MMNLVVMSKQQELLDSFFESLFPTIDDTVRIFVLSKDLEVPTDERVTAIHMPKFEPNKYFNQVARVHCASEGYMAIVNDDIIFSDGWLQDVNRKLKDYSFVSPGFVETKDKTLFKIRIKDTMNMETTTEGTFDAFYIFPVSAITLVGYFDEDIVEWYDIDWYLRMTEAGIESVVSDKVTIMHLKRMTYSLEEPNKKRIKAEIIKKHKMSGLNKAKKSWKIRKKFNA